MLTIQQKIKALGLITSFLILFSFPLASQSLAFDVLGGKDKISVPFDYKLGYIVIKLKFHNSLPLNFIFDTGSENVILFQKEMAEILQMKYDKTVKIQGADLSKKIDGYIYRGVYLEVDKLHNVKRDIIVLDKDILELHKHTGMSIHGILGTSFFKGLIVHIDYKNNQLVIYDSRNFNSKKLRRYTTMPIEMQSSKAYIKCNIQLKDETQELDLLVDTGAGVSVLLYDDQSMDKSDNSAAIIPVGKMGTVVTGSLNGYLGRINHLQLGNFEFHNIISHLIQQDSSYHNQKRIIKKRGLIGNTILSRFDIIIDFFHNALYLKPYKSYYKPFKFDKSGMEVYAIGEGLDKYLVNFVLKYSPAYFAGIKKGDIILKTNGRKMKYYNLAKLSKLLSKRIGTPIKMTILRNNTRIKKQFILYDFLLPIQENTEYIWKSFHQFEIY